MSTPNDPSPLYQSERLSPLPDETELARRFRVFTRSRRMTGAVVGFLMGAVFVAILETVNRILLPNLPLYAPPPGLPWSALLGGLTGSLIGLIATWTGTPPPGIFYASLTGAVIINAVNLYMSPKADTTFATLIAILIAILPSTTALIAAAIIIFRWALDRQQAAVQDRRSLLLRLGIPLLLVMFSAGAAWTQQYPPYAKTVILRMQALVEKGLAAPDDASLPLELSPKRLEGFRQNAVGPYTLQWDRDPNNRYMIPRPGNADGQESLAIARFENDWMLICLYPRPDWEPRCVVR
jgi:hypothetical protein